MYNNTTTVNVDIYFL